MSMSWRDLEEAIERMTTSEKDGDAHVKIDNAAALYPVRDLKVAEKSLNDEEPSVVFLTI